MIWLTPVLLVLAVTPVALADAGVVDWLGLRGRVPVEQRDGGMWARRTIVCGEVISSVPLARFLRPRHEALESMWSHSTLLRLPPDQRRSILLALALVHERYVVNEEASDWATYVSSLPTAEEATAHHPWFWNRQSRRLLQDEHLAESLEELSLPLTLLLSLLLSL